MKLNIASNAKRVDGFINMDAQPGDVDIIQDITEPPYFYGDDIIPDSSVDEILSQETLEHVGFRDLQRVLGEWFRILRDGGKLNIQVPDIGLMCEYYAKGLICECVPRKAESYDNYVANKDCFNCHGNAVIHPERWRFAFSGAQKHKYDAHLNHFTKHIMEQALNKAGFANITFHPNIYKIVVTATK